MAVDIRIQLIERAEGNIHMNLSYHGRATPTEHALLLALGNTARVIVEAAGQPESATGVTYDDAARVLTLPPIEIKNFT